VKVEKLKILKNIVGGHRALNGSRAKPWPGVQGAGGPR